MIASNSLPFASVRGVINVYPFFAALPSRQGLELGFNITVQYFPLWCWLCFFGCVIYSLVKDENELALLGFIFGVVALLMESTILAVTLGRLIQMEIGSLFVGMSLVFSLALYKVK
jgi:hypothetical protein